ncbi:MAG: hypothetical protein R3E39_13845 [Anaerolineae bacterium]
MDIILVVLRLIHIVSAFAWFGLGVTLTLYVVPAAVSAGDTGFRYLKSLFLNTAFAKVIPIVSGVTTLAGILLYLVGNSASHFSQTGNMVLGIGAAAGLIATIHGGAVTGRATRALGMALAKDGTPLAELNDLTAKLSTHARLSLVLMVIALVCMGSARYL